MTSSESPWATHRRKFQPASTPTLEVYLGWLLKQADLECIEIPLLEERLIQFAEAERLFLRMQLLAQKTQSMNDQLDQETILDRCALKHSLRFNKTAAEKAREALFFCCIQLAY